MPDSAQLSVVRPPPQISCSVRQTNLIFLRFLLPQDFSQPFLSPVVSGVPPPPPPLPPPPDELDPPPKPPFADEEEEEEMLLRETCLMSMANKRVVVEVSPPGAAQVCTWTGGDPPPFCPQETSCSRPPSPSLPPSPAGVQPPIRGNLSTVSLNTVTQPRSNKFSRGHHAPRAPLVVRAPPPQPPQHTSSLEHISILLQANVTAVMLTSLLSVAG